VRPVAGFEATSGDLAVDGGAADGEQFGNLGDRVLAGAVQLQEQSALSRVQPGRLAL
jgi:hypothetical protein